MEVQGLGRSWYRQVLLDTYRRYNSVLEEIKIRNLSPELQPKTSFFRDRLHHILRLRYLGTQASVVNAQKFS